MTTIAVTGAAGSVGRRVVKLLSTEPGVGAVRALDRRALVPPFGVDFHQVDVAGPGAAQWLEGCDSIVHLADDSARRSDETASLRILEQVLASVERVGCPHMVLLSSALVYGAYPGNPVPLTEQHRRRPIPTVPYAIMKARLEETAEAWADDTGSDLAILRPTSTFSEREASYIAGALQAATSLRSDQVDSPVQFLHHDDLAAAVCLVATKRMTSIFNVAPDGWIGPEIFRDLLAEAELHWPEPLNEAYGRLARAIRQPRIERGLSAYIDYPWVIANDRLRAAGWDPAFSNEETFVLGTPPPVWRTFTSRRRQELALGAVGAAAALALAGAGLLTRRIIRHR